MERIQEIKNRLPAFAKLPAQMAMYAVIGAFSATIDFCIFLILKGIFPTLLANTVSVCVGILTSYALNSRITFRRDKSSRFAIVKFFIVGIFGLFISNVSLYLITDELNFPEGPSKLFTLPIVALFQFLLNKFWTFRNNNSGKLK